MNEVWMGIPSWVSWVFHHENRCVPSGQKDDLMKLEKLGKKSDGGRDI